MSIENAKLNEVCTIGEMEQLTHIKAPSIMKMIRKNQIQSYRLGWVHVLLKSDQQKIIELVEK